jgi:pimeloyl-ACP methyl ester carboxylesterase
MAGFSLRRALLIVAGGMLLISGCTSDASSSRTATTAATATSTTVDASGVPSIDGRFAVGADQRQLAIMCWGDGSPTVVFDAGTGDAGISRWRSSPITRALAHRTRVCAYDRAGLGASDPAPAHPRTLDEVVDDLHGLLAAAQIAGPVVFVGSSGGGFDVYEHAGRYPDEVAGLVMLDVPAGQAAIAPSEVPAWDSAENPEHMDYVAVEHQMAVGRLPIPPIPVTVVTASRGQSTDPTEQQVWLVGSSRPIQVVLEGGHNIYDDDPAGVMNEILAVITAA